MLASTKYTYALDMWTVERRPNGWYFSKSAYHGDKHNWRGPDGSEFSVTLMIARELRREIVKRYQRQTNEAAPRGFTPNGMPPTPTFRPRPISIQVTTPTVSMTSVRSRSITKCIFGRSIITMRRSKFGYDLPAGPPA